MFTVFLFWLNQILAKLFDQSKYFESIRFSWVTLVNCLHWQTNWVFDITFIKIDLNKLMICHAYLCVLIPLCLIDLVWNNSCAFTLTLFHTFSLIGNNRNFQNAFFAISLHTKTGTLLKHRKYLWIEKLMGPIALSVIYWQHCSDNRILRRKTKIIFNYIRCVTNMTF